MSDSQNVGAGIGSQYSEQMFASHTMFGRMPDPRYPPEMTLIESNDIIGSHGTTNMTVRTNLANNQASV